MSFSAIHQMRKLPWVCLRFLVWLSSVACIVEASKASVLYVKSDAATGGNGASWQSAYNELVPAIKAATAGDEIWIARGIYRPDYNLATGTHTGDRSLFFELKSNVSWFGGFEGTEGWRSQRDWASNRTILSGDIGKPGDFLDNTYSVIASRTEQTNLLLEGLIIFGGRANFEPPAGDNSYPIKAFGGGISLFQGSLECRHCIFIFNAALYTGGGIWLGQDGVLEDSNRLTLVNCSFYGNGSTYGTGGVYYQPSVGTVTLSGCTFVGNGGQADSAVAVGYQVTSNYTNNFFHLNRSGTEDYENSSTVSVGGSPGLLVNNVLQRDFENVPAGTTSHDNKVVPAPTFFVPYDKGPDNLLGTLDDVYDLILAGDSGAVDSGNSDLLARDSTDEDGDGDIDEPTPYDQAHQPRQRYLRVDAGAYEFEDTETIPPIFSEPAANLQTRSNVTVAFRLREVPLPGTLQLEFLDGSTTKILHLASTLESVGDHTFTLDLIDPVGSSGGAVVSGPAIPDGGYSIILSYRDLLAHTAASTTHSGIVINGVDPTPLLDLPAADTTNQRTMQVSFYLPEQPAPGTLTLGFARENTVQELILAESQEAAGTHVFTIDTKSGGPSAFVRNNGYLDDGIYDVTLSYKKLSGTMVVAPVHHRFKIDTFTEWPSLTAPEAESVLSTPVKVSFTLPEAASPGSERILFSKLGLQVYLKLRDFGPKIVNTVSFDPRNPVASSKGDIVAISGGASIPDGKYFIRIEYTDAVGNPSDRYSKAISYASDVVIDTTGPELNLPEVLNAEATSAEGAVATYNFSATDALSGLEFSSVNLPSGSLFPIGTSTVEATAKDKAGNTSTKTLLVNVRDTTAPTLIIPSNFYVEATSSAGATVSYTSASASDAVGVTSLIYSHPSGVIFPLGFNTVEVKAADAAGNTNSKSFIVAVRDTTAPTVTLNGDSTVYIRRGYGSADPGATAFDSISGVLPISVSGEVDFEIPGTYHLTYTATDTAGNSGFATRSLVVVFTPREEITDTDNLVPGAGEANGPPAGTTFESFSTPAISDDGSMVARATLRASSSRFSCIYVRGGDGGASLLTWAGMQAPGMVAKGATFKKFFDPIIAPGGAIAFVATLQGASVKTNIQEGLWSNLNGGALQMLLRQHEPVAAAHGALLESIVSTSIRNEEVLVLVKLVRGKANVSAANDMALLRFSKIGPSSVLLRSGDHVSISGVPSHLLSFSILIPAPGSPGHGRWHGDNGVVARLKLAATDHLAPTSALIQIAPDGSLHSLLTNAKPEVSTGVLSSYSAFGLPALSPSGHPIAVHATLRTSPNVTAKSSQAIVITTDGASWTSVARSGLSGLAEGIIYTSFDDPLINDAGEVAFMAKEPPTKSFATGRATLWSGLVDQIQPLATLGDLVPFNSGPQETRVWTRFVSYALLSGIHSGVVLLAEIKAPSQPTGAALCVRDSSSGNLKPILQTGSSLETGGPAVTSISLLTVSVRDFGVTRSFNAKGSVGVLASFSDGTQSLLRVNVP